MPSIPEPPDRIADDLVELRAIAEWDIPEVLIAHQDDPELASPLGLSRPPSGAQLGSEVDDEPARRVSGEGIRLTIVEPGGNDCRGRVEVGGIDWERGSADMCVWVAPQLRGRGYEQRAAELAGRWLQSSVGLSELTVSLLA